MTIATDTHARLLIVDDNPAIHQDIRKILAPRATNKSLDDLERLMFGESPSEVDERAYEIDDAYQGQEALAIVSHAFDQKMPFDLAIVDMRMPPGWDGVETIERMWKVDPDLQIVICTAFSDYSWEDIADRLGVQDKLLILKKPFDDCELLQAARALSVKRRLACQARYNLDTLEALVALRNKELQSLHEESERLLSAISAGLVAYNASGCVTRWNAVAERIFGLPARSVISRQLVELPIEWQDRGLFCEFFNSNRCVESKRMATTLHGPGNERTMVELTLHPVELDGLPAGGLLLVDDVTERRTLEQQLHQAQKLESVGQLAAGIAHEINTPMQYVGDNVQFLHEVLEKIGPALHLLQQLINAQPEGQHAITERIRQSIGDVDLTRLLEQAPQAISDVEHGVDNVVRIVQAMKELSHPGSDTPGPVDINRILEGALVVSRPIWKHIATVEKNLEPNPPGLVGFGNQLQQAVLNLLVNATHAIESHRRANESLQGKICLTSRTVGDRFLICVEDNGCGIASDIGSRIYDPFFTTKDVGKGTGQGLAITHQVIVKNHRGRLWFESQVGVGTTFFIELPTSSAVL